MNDLLSKLSSYNLFNYLLPGILFAVIAPRITHFSFWQRDIVTDAFVYYFIGMVVSRVGSIVVEPLLKRVYFLKFADYKDFVAASKDDPKIELLSEANNTYRTLCSLFLLLLMLKLYEKIEGKFPVLQNWNVLLIVTLLLVMFLLAYRKQTGYITKRIKAND